MKARTGFTLIEVLIAGVISSVMGIAVLSTFYMTTAQIKEGTSYQKMSLIQTTVTAELERLGRSGYTVQTENESGVFEDALTGGLHDSFEKIGKKHVYFCDHDGNPYAGYRISGDVLLEWKGNDASGWPIMEPLVIGGIAVHVNPANSGFDVLKERVGIRYALQFKDVAAPEISFPLSRGSVQCRNHNR
jgi:type II secretory pathway pseudopilin PulG